MNPCRIYKDDYEIPSALSKLSTTVDELKEVIANTLVERISCVDVDVLNAKGQISHIIGTRYLRFLFLKKGWTVNRHKNVETVADPKSGIQIAYQNTDVAANLIRDPKPISLKGRGSEDLVDDAQGSLFNASDIASYPAEFDATKLNKSIWYLCVSFHDEDKVRAELSLPRAIKNGNFCGFFDRIFLIQNDDFQINENTVENDQFDIEPKIVRKF